MWSIEYDPATQTLTTRLLQQVTTAHMLAFARAHTQALASTGGDAFRVLADLRGLTPLESDGAAILRDVRRATLAMPGFLRRAVLTDSPTVVMQQRRTVLEDGDPRDREIITLDEAEARAFLARE